MSEGRDNEYTAIIKDAQFSSRMQTGEVAFSNGDIFKVVLRTIQSKTSKGDLRVKYEILKVLKHSRMMKQGTFDLEFDD